MTDSFQAFIKAVPDIIKASAQSEAALFALMVLVLGVLTVYLWRTQVSVAVRVAMFMLLFCGVIAYGWQLSRLSAPYEVFGHITDKATTKSVAGAQIRFSDASLATLRSDCDGLFRFWTTKRPDAIRGSISVEHPDYDTLTAQISVENLMHLELQHRITRNPASEVPSPLGPETQIVERSSGPQLSGASSGWSGWYSVRVGAAPNGYTVDLADFWLTGDRQCGAWAECQQLQRDDSVVKFRFRLQGHNEWPPPGQGLSEGHLRVRYKRKLP